MQLYASLSTKHTLKPIICPGAGAGDSSTTEGMLNNINTKDLLHTCKGFFYQGSNVLNNAITLF